MLYKILETCIFYIRWIFVDVIALRVKYKIYCTLPTLRLLWYIFSLMYIVGNIDSYQTKNKHLCWKLLMGFTTSCTMHLFYLFFSHALLLPASRHTNEIYLNCRWWGKFLWRKIASWLYNTYNKTQGQIYFLLFWTIYNPVHYKNKHYVSVTCGLSLYVYSHIKLLSIFSPFKLILTFNYSNKNIINCRVWWKVLWH